MSEEQAKYKTEADDHFDRLRAETTELRDRITKLREFIKSDKFLEIDSSQQALLKIQSKAMDTYHYCLCARLDLIE
jgi:uncharacterized protein YdcH (DUF465 family)